MLLAGALVWGCTRKPTTAPSAPALTDLSPEDVMRLDRRRALVQEAITRGYQAPQLTRTPADLPALQRLLDDGVFARTQRYQLQSVGIVFGDVLATELPLWWMLATADGKSWPTLRFRDTTIQIHPMSLISTPIENGEKVNLAALLRATREALEQLD
jgi:hypothetical protein